MAEEGQSLQESVRALNFAIEGGDLAEIEALIAARPKVVEQLPDLAVVVAAIRCHLLERSSDPLNEARKRGRVRNIAVRQVGGDDEASGVDAEVELAPTRTSTAGAMFGACPLSLPEDLEPGRIDHEMDRSWALSHDGA